jgi:flagellar hook assembly protein FlgD
MKRVTWIFSFAVFCFLVNSAFAGEPVVVDKTGTDWQNAWYVGTYGTQIAVDDNGKVHMVYLKTWATETDKGFKLMYANVTDGTKLEVPSQQPERAVQPSAIFIGGGHNGVPIYMYYGLGDFDYNYGPEMHLQAMAKLSADGTAIEPLGLQTDKNYYHEPYYANPIAMEVGNDGIVHCILTNPSGWEVSYWNFDGTNFSEITNITNSDAANDVPGKQIPARFHRTATKGADLAVNSDGSEVTIATLHPRCNVYLHKGTFGGEIWADDWFTGLDDGSVVALYDTTGIEKGTNIPNNDPKPYTEVQVVYDANNNLHVVYEATYIDIAIDTMTNFPAGSWSQTYRAGCVGDKNACFYDGSVHPKPQLLYWNSTSNTITTLAEAEYPLPGEEYKWFVDAKFDSGCWSKWGKTFNDGFISDIELIANKDPQEGEPDLVCVWEEKMGEPVVLSDTSNWYGAGPEYIAHFDDFKMSMLKGGVWTAPVNLTNTPDKDERELSLARDIIDNKIHMMYFQDATVGCDFWVSYCDAYSNQYVAYSDWGDNTIRTNQDDLVNIMYQEIDLSAVKAEPIAHYTFDEGANDVSGNGYDGTFLGDAHVQNGYLVLDGNDDAVEIPRIGGEGATFSQLTYAMWVYPTVDQVPLQFSGGLNTHGWVPGAIHFKLNYGKVNVGVNGLDADVVGTTVVEPNKWSHIALTISKTEVTLYLNGAVEASSVLTAPLTNLIIGDGTLGAWTNPDVQREMTGMMEEILIYNQALSEQEIVELANVPVGVASHKNSNNIPETFNLSQNYPNPFNPTTTINYSVPTGKVKLEIYNMLGQKVRTLLDKEVTTGSYDVVWDGTDYSGKQVTSGLYLYKLTSDAGVKIKKMLFQK